jgi:hypothetical protein
MKRYLAKDIADDVRIKGPQQGLFDALYSRDQLQLEYESTMTRKNDRMCKLAHTAGRLP